MRIDLHSHSSASDGTESPAELITRAAAAKLDVIALTDHDTFAGLDAAAATAEQVGITLVPGAELSAAAGGTSVHILAYLVDRDHPELVAELDRSRAARFGRAERMVARSIELGARISWSQVRELAGDAPIGRPHIARALVASGVVRSEADAFGPDWIGDRGRAYVHRDAIDAADAIRLVRAAGGVAVFAHPGARQRGRIVGDDVIAKLAAAGLAGLEIDHPDHDPPTRARLRMLAADLGLLGTGASDDHGRASGYRLGSETTSVEAYRALIARASGATPIGAPSG
ncbi:MAG TPA: PHP domain-containing protein [Actinomycetes bacterium]|nr:PHP domain-containing protein [Actinomycetes bacterium]